MKLVLLEAQVGMSPLLVDMAGYITVVKEIRAKAVAILESFQSIAGIKFDKPDTKSADLNSQSGSPRS